MPTKEWEQMELTDELLSRYVGGQLEVINGGDPPEVRRGEIDACTLRVNGDVHELHITLRWLAELSWPAGWHVIRPTTYVVNLSTYVLNEIGCGRTMLVSIVTQETVVFYRQGGSRLDPAHVSGLQSP